MLDSRTNSQIKNAIDLTGSNWLSGKSVIRKSGITKKEFLLLLKYGIIPKPVIRVSETSRKGSRKNGYFPKSILERLKMVDELKKEGHPMDVIAKRFKDERLKDEKTNVDERLESKQTPPGPEMSVKRKEDGKKLSLDDLYSPAILTDHDYNILWIGRKNATGLIVELFDMLQAFNHNNIIQFILDPDVKAGFSAWHELLFQFKDSIKTKVTEPGTHSILLDMPEDDQIDRPSRLKVERVPLRKGWLHIFNILDDETDPGYSDQASEAHRLRKIRLSALSARIDNSKTLRDQRLAAEYHNMVLQLINEANAIINSYNGFFMGCDANGFNCYFPAEENGPDCLKSIECAFDLIGKINEISFQMAKNIGLTEALNVNIGIAFGSDYVQKDVPGKEGFQIDFSISGGPIEMARKISKVSGCGEIWCSKPLIESLESDEIKRLRFGIKKEGALINHLFMRITDLYDSDDCPEDGDGSDSCLITNIVDCHPGTVI